nr:immunoglobulin light chain junction region [Macaca mulatta]MOV79811.1 immunoglobulin light chain junction region [Macaca mulatta]MOV82081.1 immunoglobulin light chain junction region [Macaca mulatta]MOV82993.1 immunoglobulin light chain junction region [Macaca mulatta]MOV83369.1 immunoglobulin light chain junction region [Macaca mulatta]
CMQALDFPFTF